MTNSSDTNAIDTTSLGLATQAIAAAGDAIVTVDTQGHIISWNPAAESLFGHSVDQAVGQTLALIIPDAHRARHIAAFRTAMQSGSLAHGGRPARVEAMTADGQIMPIAMSLGLLHDPKGEPSGAIAVLRREDRELVPFVSPTEQSTS